MATPVFYLRNRVSVVLAKLCWPDGVLADKSGLTRVRVNKIKNRRVQPRIGEVLAIARVFDARAEDLFELTHRKPRSSVLRECIQSHESR